MDKRSGKDRRKIITMLDPSKERRSGKDRRILDQIVKLSIKDGDIIVIRVPSLSFPVRKTLDDIGTYIKSHGGALIICKTSAEIQKFNEKQMNKMGWYRKDGDTKWNS